MHEEAPADVFFSHYQSAPAFKHGCFCVTHPLWWAYRNKKLELFDDKTTRPSTSGTNNLFTDTSPLNDIVKRATFTLTVVGASIRPHNTINSDANNPEYLYIILTF